MVLDSEPKSTGNNIDLSIPDPDKAGAFVPGVAVPEVKPPSASSAVVSGPTQAVREPDVKKPLAAPAQQAAPKAPLHKPADAPRLKKAKNVDKPAGAEGYVAQVGAYSNPGTAKQEFKKLKQLGFKVYTEKVGGNIRVRVGPYTDRDKAEKAGHQLEKHGYHPVIVSSK